MGTSSRMTVATHAPTWMAWVCPRHPDGIVTSGRIAASVISLHSASPHQACPVGRGLPPALRQVYGRAEEPMKAEPAAVTVADVARETVPGL
ncbi:hypothetical protein [Streptomyces lancefieldiae]|uniref:Uncharacterized protein n=1 Tax=Streptomyces lancefieldiae TaxID=3075520 RepID=A0ABU3AR51_9ACTN|nr:hypothetical protein [Streptomyces sp. DSM 40712]MDT0612683.1 hypothetical protein [Streptomyces sp. DSM 40712]